MADITVEISAQDVIDVMLEDDFFATEVWFCLAVGLTTDRLKEQIVAITGAGVHSEMPWIIKEFHKAFADMIDRLQEELPEGQVPTAEDVRGILSD